jgi:hypothetical protein
MRYAHLSLDARRDVVKLLDVRDSAKLVWMTSRGIILEISLMVRGSPYGAPHDARPAPKSNWRKPRGFHKLSPVTIIRWNGRDLPAELKDLPAGDYAVQPAEDVVALTQEEEAGLVAALESLQAGKGVAHEEVRKRVLRHVQR